MFETCVGSESSVKPDIDFEPCSVCVWTSTSDRKMHCWDTVPRNDPSCPTCGHCFKPPTAPSGEESSTDVDAGGAGSIAKGKSDRSPFPQESQPGLLPRSPALSSNVLRELPNDS